MPFAPGMRSEGSPRSATKSGTSSGGDAVDLLHLGRADAHELALAGLRAQDRRPRAGELEEVAVVGEDERLAAARLLRAPRRRRGSRRPRSRPPSPSGKPSEPDELGQPVELRRSAPAGSRGPTGTRGAARSGRSGRRPSRSRRRPSAAPRPPRRAASMLAKPTIMFAWLPGPVLDRRGQRVEGAVGEVVAVDRQKGSQVARQFLPFDPFAKVIADVEDPRHRREALRRPRPRGHAAGHLQAEPGQDAPRRRRLRHHVGGRATSSASPSPTSTTRS